MTTLPPPEEHIAPTEPHPVPKSTWQRWRDWSGTNFIISILIHLVIILVATLVVVQVMQPREKPKFKSAPPSPNPPSEHSVKAAKKSASMSVPTISKRITTTAANAQVALPAMEMSSQMPDMMSGALGNLGANGLGAGASAGGVGALPPGGLTAFGFRSASSGTIVGTFYDLTQSSDKKQIPMDQPKYRTEVDSFVRSGMSDASLNRYFHAPDKIYSSQFFIPKIPATDGPAAFNMTNPISAWLIHYHGVVTPPVSGTYRLWGVGDDIMTVQLDHQIVLNFGFITPLNREVPKVFRVYDGLDPYAWCKGLGEGKQFTLYAGQHYPIDILIGHQGEGFTMAIILVEKVKEGDEKDGGGDQKDSKGNPILPILRFNSRTFKKPTGEMQAPVFAPDTGYSVWKTEVPK